jgi:hypothetical protein
MILFGSTVLLGIALLRAVHSPVGAVAARVGLGVILAAFVSAEIAVWMPYTYQGAYNYYPHQWWETAGVLALFGGLAAFTLVGLGRGERRLWRWVGIGAGTIAAMLWLVHIWVGTGSDIGEVTFVVLLGLTVVIAHAVLSLLAPLSATQTWVRTTALGSVILTAALLDALVIDDKLVSVGIDDEVLGRCAAASAIVAGCSTLALIVLARINRRVDLESLTTDFLTMAVVCPRCAKKQVVQIGGAVCSACKLRITIQVEEPRCPKCDYLLYGLPTSRCPECGTSVTAETATGPAS